MIPEANEKAATERDVVTDPTPRETAFALDPTEYYALLRVRYRLALTLVEGAATAPVTPDAPCPHQPTAHPGDAQGQDRRAKGAH